MTIFPLLVANCNFIKGCVCPSIYLSIGRSISWSAGPSSVTWWVVICVVGQKHDDQLLPLSRLKEKVFINILSDKECIPGWIAGPNGACYFVPRHPDVERGTFFQAATKCSLEALDEGLQKLPNAIFTRQTHPIPTIKHDTVLVDMVKRTPKN